MILKSVIPVEQVTDPGKGGGKACGLAFLKKSGKNIPDAWVIIQHNERDIDAFVKELPADRPYAVRSSASGEDGDGYSFAGQYQSFLNVHGNQQLKEAISDCFASSNAGTVISYKREFHFDNANGMNVIVQEMIQPIVSGVLFTADPVARRRDKIVLSVTTGYGEDLMSGHTAGENITFYKHKKDLPDSKHLNALQFQKLVDEAISIENDYQKPADLEWAIDQKGVLWWLQLRPVTNLEKVHLNEFDAKPQYSPPIYTRGNIGEMMPGPVTPLTLSTFGRAIELGNQHLYVNFGVQKCVSEKNIYIHSFYNHLFMDVQALYEVPRKTWLARKENVDYSVVGDLVEGVNVKREVSLGRGIVNFVKMMRFVNQGPKLANKLDVLHDRFKIECPQDIGQCYQLIDESMNILNEAYILHFGTSSQSGSLFTTILNIYARGKQPTRNHHKMVAALYTDIPNVESADVVHSIDDIAGLLSKVPDVHKCFIGTSTDIAADYLQSKAPANIRKFWNDFMDRHGHRCVREAELREIEWAIDPTPVIEGLKAKTVFLLEHGALNKDKNKSKNKMNIHGPGVFGKAIVKNILPKARASVARREHTKAMAIGVQHKFKTAYRHLAKLLVKSKFIADADQIFFLTHSEIGEMIKSDEKTIFREIAEKRRTLYSEFQELSFSDISFGIPMPIEFKLSLENGSLKGIPVSRGVVEGKVHLVRDLTEAGKLKKGEIMVAQYTDVGWTPFYGILAGLITEIGSPLSHGAVVAREYDLPTIVSVKGALSTLIDGQKIRMDAVHGKIEVIE